MITHGSAAAPVKIVLYIVFGLLTAVLGYAAFQTSTEIRSQAAEHKPDCKHGQVPKSAGKVCKIIGKTKKGEVKKSCKTNWKCVDKKPAPVKPVPTHDPSKEVPAVAPTASPQQ